MRIYTVCMGEDIGCIADHYVTRRSDVPQLIIDHYWGTEIELEPGRLTVDDNLITNVAILRDANDGREHEYNVLYFDPSPKL